MVIVGLVAAAAAGCYALAVVKLVALFSDRSRSLILREYTIAAASIGVTFTLLLPPVISAIDQFSANLALLCNSLVGIGCLTAGQTILVASRPGPEHLAQSRRTVRRWWIACFVIVVVRAALFISAPAYVHHTEMVDFAPNYARYPTLALFDGLRLAWFTVVFTNMIRGYRAYARQESSGPTRWGMLLHCWAGYLGLFYVTYQVAYVVALWLHHPLPGVERAIGTLMLLSVVSTVLLATAILYLGPNLEARLTYRALGPLWRLVAANRVGAILDDRQFTHTERLIRRRQENIDGLARLRNHYDAVLWQDTFHHAQSSGVTIPRAKIIADAATINGALTAEREGRLPAREPMRHVPSGPQEAELAWQIAVGKALREPTARPWRHGGTARGEQ